MTYTTAKTVAICDTEPIAIEGLRAVLKSCGDLDLVGAETSLIAAMDLVRRSSPSIVIMDKGFGSPAVLDCIQRMKATNGATAPIIWGMSLNEPDALRLLQGGARGVMRKTADTDAILGCIRAVASGNTWMEEALFHGGEKPRGMRMNLTARELQIMELVEQGLKNREIARALGIRPGTVKIHLKHIFEKTGIRGRYALALTGLKEKGLLELPVA